MACHLIKTIISINKKVFNQGRAGKKFNEKAQTTAPGTQFYRYYSFFNDFFIALGGYV